MMTIEHQPLDSLRIPTVFLLDDDPEVGKSMAWLLGSVGLNVQAHQSAFRFLETFNAEQPGCVILDIRMPEMGGLDVLERLRASGATIPIIIVTAYADVTVAVRAMKAGATHVFEKPVSDQELIDEIQAAIAQDLASRQKRSAIRAVFQKFASLTDREREVVQQVVSGVSSKDIAQKLGVSHRTVEAHRMRIMRKLEVDSIAQLVSEFILVESEAVAGPLSNRMPSPYGLFPRQHSNSTSGEFRSNSPRKSVF